MSMPFINGAVLVLFAFAAIAAYFIGKTTGKRRALALFYYRLGGTKAISDLMDFHEKFEHTILNKPAIPDRATRLLRRRLIAEETQEFFDAWENDDIVAIADALADITYVVLGTALSYGIYFPTIFSEVHRSNMAKGPGKDAFGKTLKPKGWKPPDIVGILRSQGAKI